MFRLSICSFVYPTTVQIGKCINKLVCPWTNELYTQLAYSLVLYCTRTKHSTQPWQCYCQIILPVPDHKAYVLLEFHFKLFHHNSLIAHCIITFEPFYICIRLCTYIRIVHARFHLVVLVGVRYKTTASYVRSDRTWLNFIQVVSVVVRGEDPDAPVLDAELPPPTELVCVPSVTPMPKSHSLCCLAALPSPPNDIPRSQILPARLPKLKG